MRILPLSVVLLLIALAGCKKETVAPSQSDLQITMTIDATDTIVGAMVTFKIIVLNNGPDNANSVKVLDTIPSGFQFVGATVTKGIYSGPDWILGLPTNTTETLTIKATVKATGSYINTVWVTGTNFDSDKTNNVAAVFL